MDWLKTQLELYKDATQKEPKAKRALIQAFHQIALINTILEREISDRASFDTLFDQMVTKNCKLVKEIAHLTELLALAKKDTDIVRNDRKHRVATSRATAVASAAPVVNVIVNNYTGVPPITAHVTETPRSTQVGGHTAKKTKEKISKQMRETIWEKYIGDKAKVDCPVCQIRQIRMTDFSAGHIIAEAEGGVTDVTNLIPICGNCNSRMYTTNLYEYSRKNFGRDPVFPVSQTSSKDCSDVITHVSTVTPSIQKKFDKKASGPKVIKHDHCRAISGSEIEKRSFSTDDEAIAFAKEHGYTAITHRTGSQAMYYFTSKANMKFKISSEEGKGAWDFTSWELVY